MANALLNVQFVTNGRGMMKVRNHPKLRRVDSSHWNYFRKIFNVATIDECIEFALNNIGLWWRYGISRHCDEWKYIIIGRIFESEIILVSNGNVKLHVGVFFLLHLVSNDVKLHTSLFLLHLLSYTRRNFGWFRTFIIPRRITIAAIGTTFGNLQSKWSKQKPRTCNFTLPLQALGPIGYDCYRSLWNKLEQNVLEISN
jgi:hypothetical protein